MEEPLGQYLKRLRKERFLTLRAVEEKTGVSNAYLSQVENGKIISPSPTVLSKLAECYHIPYGRLLELAGHPPVSETERLIQFKTSSGLEELNEQEEKELLEYLKFLRSRRRE